MSTESHRSDRAPEPVGDYPHARRAGGFLYLSGVGPRRRGSTDIPGVTLDGSGAIIAADIEVQCRSCFDNVRAVLEDAGCCWNDLVDVQVFLTDMARDFEIYNRIYAEYFAGEGNPNPTRTTIEINCLPTPIAVEVKAVAWVGD